LWQSLQAAKIEVLDGFDDNYNSSSSRDRSLLDVKVSKIHDRVYRNRCGFASPAIHFAHPFPKKSFFFFTDSVLRTGHPGHRSQVRSVRPFCLLPSHLTEPPATCIRQAISLKDLGQDGIKPLSRVVL
jgi:hypothetical protein